MYNRVSFTVVAMLYVISLEGLRLWPPSPHFLHPQAPDIPSLNIYPLMMDACFHVLVAVNHAAVNKGGAGHNLEILIVFPVGMQPIPWYLWGVGVDSRTQEDTKICTHLSPLHSALRIHGFHIHG